MSDASEVKRYKTSPGWYEINDVTEYNGASVRLKPSYTSSTEFKADLEDKQKEVSKDIFRQRDNMSDASEVKRFIHWFGPDYDGSAQFSQEVVLASDHDRIMAERDELWKRATKFVMPGEMDTGESIEHYIKTLEQTVAELRADLSTCRSITQGAFNVQTDLKAEIDELRAEIEQQSNAYEFALDNHVHMQLTIARQARVIEKLKATIDGTILYVNLAGAEYLREQADELVAIEKEGEGQ